MTSEGPAHRIALVTRSQTVHRVGYRPAVWRWTPWRYATNGRFNGRWDDPDGIWRTLYVGDSRLACYLELIACMRPDPILTAAFDDLDDTDAEDDTLTYPTASAGLVPLSWCDSRLVGTATLHGPFVQIGDISTIASLRIRFRAPAMSMGLADLDAAALRDARPRALTQAISAYLYRQRTPDDDIPVTGIEFSSRHADNCRLWAVYERPGDPETSPHLDPHLADESVDPTDLLLSQAISLLGLTWA